MKLLAIFLSFIAVYFAYELWMPSQVEMKMNKKMIRMAYDFDATMTELDPAKIRTIYQYNLIRNLYGRLVEYDSNSNLIAGVPTSFSWHGNEIEFVFGDRATTIDGHIITARDAELSLKRLIVLGKSGHGDIRRFICPDHVLENIDDACPGIKTSDNRLIIKVVASHFVPILLEALESADYSIIPADVLTKENLSLLREHRNTSGPYYIEAILPNGGLVLKANPHHYLFDPNMPQTIETVVIPYSQAIQSFQTGVIDLLPTTQNLTESEITFFRDSKSAEIHETLPLKLSIIRFSPSALRNFSIDQRLYAGLHAIEVFKRKIKYPDGKPTVQFFQALSDGALTEDQLKELKQQRENIAAPRFERQIGIKVLSSYMSFLYDELKKYPEFSVSETKTSVISLAPENRPDMYVVTTDSAWTEDFNLIGYHFHEQTFLLPGMDPDAWLKNYIETSDKTERIAKLNRLHFELLKNVIFIPYHVSPYFAVARKPWHLNQSNLSAGTCLWRLRTN